MLNNINLIAKRYICVESQFISVSQSCLTLCNPMNRSTPGLPVHHRIPELLKLTSIQSVMPSSHLILCCPLFFLPPIPPSIRVFSNESTLRMRWPQYWITKQMQIKMRYNYIPIVSVVCVVLLLLLLLSHFSCVRLCETP